LSIKRKSTTIEEKTLENFNTSEIYYKQKQQTSDVEDKKIKKSNRQTPKNMKKLYQT
jgi:hypothetical protein